MALARLPTVMLGPAAFPHREAGIKACRQPFGGFLFRHSRALASMSAPDSSAPSRPPKIKTRILIISDTHGSKPKPKIETDPSTEDELSQEDIRWTCTGFREQLPEADVAIHCGDLTKRSRVDEFKDTFDMLRALRAPVKLVIAGNHDLALDEAYFYRQFGGSRETVEKVREIVHEARADGVHYLTEGTHSFTLDNGARLQVFASPHTPEYGGWAFQYRDGHDFPIPEGVDVAMTHGPPSGVLDYAGMSGTRAGCPDLFKAVYRAKPQIHCFGHIHEAWGTVLARWKEPEGERISRETVIVPDPSKEIKLANMKFDRLIHDEETVRKRREGLIEVSKRRGMYIDLTEGEAQLTQGEQTLFVNASVMDMRYRPIQMPWLLDLNLPKAEITGLI